MSQIKNNRYSISLDRDAAPRKSDRTRQSIQEAALKYLWTNPYRDLTISELMSLAGNSRSAFYLYYDDLPSLMEHLLQELKEKLFAVTAAWFFGEGDPIPLLMESLGNMVSACYQHGPILRAVADAAPMNEHLEKAWMRFVKDFDDAVTQRIEHQQAIGLIKPFDARPVAIALNRMDADLVRHHFGRRPRSSQNSVRKAIIRIWVATLYGDDALKTCFQVDNTMKNQKHKLCNINED